MATAFTPAAAASVALETRLARTRAVSLDLLRQLLEGPGSAEWLSRLAPVLGKPLRAALAGKQICLALRDTCKPAFAG